MVYGMVHRQRADAGVGSEQLLQQVNGLGVETGAPLEEEQPTLAHVGGEEGALLRRQLQQRPVLDERASAAFDQEVDGILHQRRIAHRLGNFRAHLDEKVRVVAHESRQRLESGAPRRWQSIESDQGAATGAAKP